MRATTASSATCGSIQLVNHRWSTRLRCRGQRAQKKLIRSGALLHERHPINHKGTLNVPLLLS